MISDRTLLKLGPVDVVMCTWNSNKPYFKRCLESVKREIPVHHFILIDRYSQDGTLETVKKYFDSVVVKHSKENLARARMIGISLVDTEYFVFVDSDVELPVGWFKQMLPYVDNNVGACHDQGYVPQLAIISKLYEWHGLDKKLVRDVTPKNASRYRGCTHSTIVKTSVVKDWKPSTNLSAYEDWMLLRHVVKKGYVWRIINRYSVRHHTPRNLREGLEKVRWTFAGGRVTGFERIPATRRLPAHLLLVSLQAFRMSFKYKEPRIFPYIVLWRLAQIDGYLRWNKFVVLERK